MTRAPDPAGTLDLPALVRAALAEDVGTGDVTTRATVPPGRAGRARILAKSEGVVAGLDAARETYRQVDSAVAFRAVASDGTAVAPGELVATAQGSFASLLTAERTALNFLQRLSGVATLAARFGAAVEGTGARVVDTRKTTPGWRALEKSAVRAGGATNHRMGLWDAYLVKENHVAGAGGVAAALAAVATDNDAGLPVEVEVRSLVELDEALSAEPPPERVMCDHFSIPDLAEAVARVRARRPGTVVEASGNVTLATVRSIAETGVDWISVGALTHSAPALDLTCLVEGT